MNRLILSLVWIPSVLFGASSSSPSRAELDMIEEQQLGPFDVSAYNGSSFVVETNFWEPANGDYGGSVVFIGGPKTKFAHSEDIARFFVIFMDRFNNGYFSHPSFPDQFKKRVYNAWQEAVTPLSVKDEARPLMNKAAIFVSLIGGHESLAVTLSGERREDQAVSIPLFDKAEDLGDVVSYTLRLPDSEDDDGSPVVTWTKPE